MLASGRMPSSLANLSASPFFCGTSTGTTSSANLPASHAAAARRWLRAAYSSAASREMPYARARFSAVSIIPEM